MQDHIHRGKLNMPLVSVLMPAFNCARYIETAIDSILNQTYRNIELLVVDDASTDDTADIVENYKDSRVKLRRNSQNGGYLSTVNKLFEWAEGDYITFQDADDWSSPDRVSLQLSFLQENSEVKLCGTNCVKVFEGGRSVKVSYPRDNKSIRWCLERGRTSLFCGASIMISAEIVERIGVYREFFDRIGAEDIDWYLRVLEIYGVANLPNFLYFYRQHGESVTKVGSTNVLKYCSADFAYLFHKQREVLGADLVESFPGNARAIAQRAAIAVKGQQGASSYVDQVFNQAFQLNLKRVVDLYGAENSVEYKLFKAILYSSVGVVVALALYIVPASVMHYFVGARRKRLVAKLLDEIGS